MRIFREAIHNSASHMKLRNFFYYIKSLAKIKAQTTF